jgi:hypothetical protein
MPHRAKLAHRESLQGRVITAGIGARYMDAREMDAPGARLGTHPSAPAARVRHLNYQLSTMRK